MRSSLQGAGVGKKRSLKWITCCSVCGILTTVVPLIVFLAAAVPLLKCACSSACVDRAYDIAQEKRQWIIDHPHDATEMFRNVTGKYPDDFAHRGAGRALLRKLTGMSFTGLKDAVLHKVKDKRHRMAGHRDEQEAHSEPGITNDRWSLPDEEGVAQPPLHHAPPSRPVLPLHRLGGKKGKRWHSPRTGSSPAHEGGEEPVVPMPMPMPAIPVPTPADAAVPLPMPMPMPAEIDGGIGSDRPVHGEGYLQEDDADAVTIYAKRRAQAQSEDKGESRRKPGSLTQASSTPSAATGLGSDPRLSKFGLDEGSLRQNKDKHGKHRGRHDEDEHEDYSGRKGDKATREAVHWLLTQGNLTRAEVHDIAADFCEDGHAPVLLAGLGAAILLAFHLRVLYVSRKLLRHPFVKRQAALQHQWAVARWESQRLGLAPPPPPPSLMLRHPELPPWLSPRLPGQPPLWRAQPAPAMWPGAPMPVNTGAALASAVGLGNSPAAPGGNNRQLFEYVNGRGFVPVQSVPQPSVAADASAASAASAASPAAGTAPAAAVAYYPAGYYPGATMPQAYPTYFYPPPPAAAQQSAQVAHAGSHTSTPAPQAYHNDEDEWGLGSAWRSLRSMLPASRSGGSSSLYAAQPSAPTWATSASSAPWARFGGNARYAPVGTGGAEGAGDGGADESEQAGLMSGNARGQQGPAVSFVQAGPVRAAAHAQPQLFAPSPVNPAQHAPGSAGSYGGSL